MINNGFERAKPFTPDAITKVWQSILNQEVSKVKQTATYKFSKTRNKNLKKVLSLFFINHNLFEWRQRLRHVLKNNK